jgi:hypothetical protein
MKNRTVFSLLAAVFLFHATAASLPAQLTGFRIGVAPPPPPGTFAAAVPQFAVPFPQPLPGIPLAPNFPTVIVPNQQVFFPGQPVFPTPIVHPGPPLFVPPQSVSPGLPFAPLPPQPGLLRPPLGMNRAEVLRRFGQPSVTIITSTGETLHFNGGVTVIIQNGQVVGPR